MGETLGVNVLIVEDDDDVAVFLNQATQEAGYVTHMVGDGNAAVQAARSVEFDLILLDVMLPGLDGFEVCRRLRAGSVRSLVLIITARDSLEDKIIGLDAGADDYIAKPFHLAELLARMRALLRRGNSSSTILRVDDLTLDPDSRTAERSGKRINLSATEYALLEYLMHHAGKTLTRSILLEHVWQYNFEGHDNVLDVYISYLRRKIDKGHPRPLIQTVRGMGFRLSSDG